MISNTTREMDRQNLIQQHGHSGFMNPPSNDSGIINHDTSHFQIRDQLN